MFANSMARVVVRKLSFETMSTKKSVGHSFNWKNRTWKFQLLKFSISTGLTLINAMNSSFSDPKEFGQHDIK